MAAAVGYDEARGDVITIKSMAFEPIVKLDDPAVAPLLSRLGVDVMTLAQVGMLAFVTLVLGLFVVRPIFGARSVRPTIPARPGIGMPSETSEALTGEIEDAVNQAAGVAAAAGRVPAVADPVADADPVTRLRRMILDRREESVEILRGWMEDSEEERV